MTYEEQLKTQRWNELKWHIVTRDYGLCCSCNSTKNLHVHHIRYFTGKMAWEYESKYLMTLCKTCHERLHENFTVPVLDEPTFWLTKMTEIGMGMMALREGKLI